MSERLDVLVSTVRQVGPVPLVLRAVVLASAVVAVVATTLPAWDVPDGYVAIAVVAAGIAAVVPDSGGWFFVVAALVAGWLTGSSTAEVSPALVVTALAFLVGHVAAALAAAMPATAAADRRVVLRWWRPTATIAATTVATAALVAALDAWRPPGSIGVVMAALAVAGLGVWWWSAGAEPAE